MTYRIGDKVTKDAKHGIITQAHPDEYFDVQIASGETIQRVAIYDLVGCTTVTWCGYLLEIEHIQDQDGSRAITIADPRMYLNFGALVHYDPKKQSVNKIQCSFPITWAERTRSEDLPCLIAITSLVYCYAITLAKQYDIFMAQHPPAPFQIPAELPFI